MDLLNEDDEVERKMRKKKLNFIKHWKAALNWKVDQKCWSELIFFSLLHSTWKKRWKTNDEQIGIISNEIILLKLSIEMKNFAFTQRETKIWTNWEGSSFVWKFFYEEIKNEQKMGKHFLSIIVVIYGIEMRKFSFRCKVMASCW